MKTAAFRVDGSPFMGIGHIMRCLTLAGDLREQGWLIHFIIRETPNHYGHIIKNTKHALHLLPFLDITAPKISAQNTPPHSAWLGTDQKTDQQQTHKILEKISAPIELLVIDHYGIDARWHQKMRTAARRIMVLDDLADRPLDCDTLLDQTFQRSPSDYKKLIPAHCQALCGSAYMLLRPEFEQKRNQALEKRTNFTGRPQHIFICMGSADPDNLTSIILDGLKDITPPLDIAIIISSKAPHLARLKDKAKTSKHHIRILEDCTTVPEEMIKADIAFGAGGTMSWERCCLGLPTFLAVIAQNQTLIARNLKEAGAVFGLGHKNDITPALIQEKFMALLAQPKQISKASQACTNICDGKGTKRVLDMLNDPLHQKTA